jgi:hypothetical protein
MQKKRAGAAQPGAPADVRRHKMEDPRSVEAAAKGFVLVSGATALGLSLFLWSFIPIAFWMHLVIGTALAFVVVAAINVVTIWPLLLLIARVFGGDRNEGKEPNKPLEPTPKDGAAHRPRSAGGNRQ